GGPGLRRPRCRRSQEERGAGHPGRDCGRGRADGARAGQHTAGTRTGGVMTAAVHPRDDQLEELDAESKALATPSLAPPLTTVPAAQEFAGIMAVSEAIAKSSLVPTAYRGKPEDVALCALTARE